MFDVPPGATGCFPRDDGYWLVVVPAGRGTLVVAGGAGAFVNQRFDEADNATLAASAARAAPGARGRDRRTTPAR